jgi:hypothetical protein
VEECEERLKEEDVEEMLALIVNCIAIDDDE